MSEELRKLRTEFNIPAKDIVDVIKRTYPSFDRTMLSKCENGAAYGVKLSKEALEAAYKAFGLEAELKAQSARKDRHRLSCRISARLTDEEFSALQKHMAADGYQTSQEWITDAVRAYLKSKEATV